MTNRKILFLRCVGGVLVLALAWLALTNPASSPPPPRQSWKPQPNRLPLGTAIQGSHIEFSVAALTQDRPPPPPGWTAKLPGLLRRGAQATHQRLISWMGMKPWRLSTDLPSFVQLQSSTLDYAPQGVRVWLELVADTSRTGAFRAPLIVRLKHRSGHVQFLNVPIELEVLPRPTNLRGRVLISETPWDGYSTDDGETFRTLASITTELAARGTQVEVRNRLPPSLDGFSIVLVAGETLSGLQPTQVQSLCKLLLRGGRLILTPDAFFGDTAAQANMMLGPCGLQVATRDAGSRMESTNVAPDRLTTSVRRLTFWRPAAITVTDSTQGRPLVLGPTGECLAAVSRSPGRGEVIVLTQSLWWNWIHSDPADADNARFLLNLLSE